LNEFHIPTAILFTPLLDILIGDEDPIIKDLIERVKYERLQFAQTEQDIVKIHDYFRDLIIDANSFKLKLAE
jgi:hypothetical protein